MAEKDCEIESSSSCGNLGFIVSRDPDLVANSGKRMNMEFPVSFWFLWRWRIVVRVILRCENVEVGGKIGPCHILRLLLPENV
jgi:hypothetical protein